MRILEGGEEEGEADRDEEEFVLIEDKEEEEEEGEEVFQRHRSSGDDWEVSGFASTSQAEMHLILSEDKNELSRLSMFWNKPAQCV